MAGDSKKVQPIIIKRIKKGGHAAHGGAWKIAYYFNSPLKIAMFGGSGAGDATSVVKGGGNNLAESTGQIKKGMSETADEKRRKKAMKMEQARASADRANASRRELIAGGLSGSKVLRVQGLAASMLFEKGNPESPLNRRISVIVMNREAEDRFFQAAKIEAIDATDDEALTGEEEPAPDIKPSRPSLTGR